MRERLEMPETLEECQATLRFIDDWVLQRSHLYVGDTPWREGHWFYREDGKLYSCPKFREGLSVLIVSLDGVSLLGVTVEEGHIETTIDKLPGKLRRDRFAS